MAEQPKNYCYICYRPESKPRLCLNYGAWSCNSCRIFFKRCCKVYYIDEYSSLKYSCKTGLEKCQIFYLNANCVKCRYLKCLEKGMDAKKILNQTNRIKYCSKHTRPKSGKQLMADKDHEW